MKRLLGIAFGLYVLFSAQANTATFADGPVCSNQSILFVADAALTHTENGQTKELPVKARQLFCLPDTTNKLYLSKVFWTDMKSVVIYRKDTCTSGFQASWPVGGNLYANGLSGPIRQAPANTGCLDPDQVIDLISGGVLTTRLSSVIGFIVPTNFWSQLPTAVLAPVTAAAPKAPTSAPTIAPVTTGSIVEKTMTKYNITRDAAGKYVVPPITDKNISLAERLAVIEMIATNHGIPPLLFKAICWVEGWDRYNGRRCQMWYDNGSPVISVTGALGAMQVSPKWHPESDATRLGNDFTYNLNESARILLGGKVSPSTTEISRWESLVKRYGNAAIADQYWSAVYTTVVQPPW